VVLLKEESLNIIFVVRRKIMTTIRSYVVFSLLAGLFAGSLTAATVWNPAANGITPPAAGNWNDPANWTAGVPVMASPGETKGVFNVPNAAECIVTDAQSLFHLVQGDNNPGGLITVKNGGSITTGVNWSAIGYNNTAQMVVEAGGSVSFGQHMWVGLEPGSVGTLDINGGTVSVAAMIGLGWNGTGGIGYVNVNDGGLLALSNIHGDGSSSVKEGLISINGTGMITLPGNFVGVINTYAGNGLIVGNGSAANVLPEYDDVNDITTVTAVPEPATMLFAALGGLFIRRKR
jgi:hypothetical protein